MASKVKGSTINIHFTVYRQDPDCYIVVCQNSPFIMFKCRSVSECTQMAMEKVKFYLKKRKVLFDQIHPIQNPSSKNVWHFCLIYNFSSKSFDMEKMANEAALHLT